MNIAVDALGGDYAPLDVVKETDCRDYAPQETIEETK